MVLTAKTFTTEFFARDTSLVARELLGQLLVTEKDGRCSAVIIETEAYYGSRDPASHAYRGPTPRNRLMFGKPGVAYVYLCYGMYNLFNMVTQEKGTPGAVLIRGAFPVEGRKVMEKRRNTSGGRLLLDGPGKLTMAMGIGLGDNGKDLTSGGSDIFLEESKKFAGLAINRTGRVGVKVGQDRLLRFYINMDESI
ncbi:MAG: DNA-3-methyladenine glycosylase [Actinomycetia bacterium]|nr:DNA-3-methyladenine glycosylase [Actinomycetes bacterium]